MSTVTIPHYFKSISVRLGFLKTGITENQNGAKLMHKVEKVSFAIPLLKKLIVISLGFENVNIEIKIIRTFLQLSQQEKLNLTHFT